MKKMLCLMIVGIMFILPFAAKSFAGEVDLLVDKLVEKDVLTPVEAQILLDETKTAVAKEIAEGKSGTLPSWIQTMTFKGDLRLRYQSEEKDTITSLSTTTAKRERARVRFRLGSEAKVTKGFKVNFGLASGGSDPRSTNQTFQDNFASKEIMLDYAYATYALNNNIDIMGGKIELSKTLWLVSDLLWDGDINPEGVFVNSHLPLNSSTEIFLNTGYFILDEMSSGADPSMFTIQPGIKWEISDAVTLKTSINYYAFNSVEGLPYSNIVDGGGTNTTSTSPASFKYDYDSLGFTAELGMNLQEDAEVDEIINYVALFGDYTKNTDPDKNNVGYLAGIKFGDKKVKDPSTWQAKVLYRTLEKDAWVDFLPDSDFLGGITDAKGYEFIVNYALAKNVILGLDYYRTETDIAASKKEQDLVQVDLLFKF
ncbi:MAG: putative porin [Candidatus Omnitrophica bacterium]|nr:putative porin [Candidatus Omnitrophota bacterium]